MGVILNYIKYRSIVQMMPLLFPLVAARDWPSQWVQYFRFFTSGIPYYMGDAVCSEIIWLPVTVI